MELTLVIFTTVLPGAEERGVQHHSLVSSLILLIPADLRSYLRSTSGHESSAMHKFCTQNAPYNHVFPNLFLHPNFQPGMFLKNLETPAWPFFGVTFFSTREYCMAMIGTDSTFAKLGRTKRRLGLVVRVLSGMRTHSAATGMCRRFYGSMVRRQVQRDVTRHFNWPLGTFPGFKYSRRTTHQKIFKTTRNYHISHTCFMMRVPL